MTSATIVAFCRVTGCIFVEEYQVRGEKCYTFLDYHGKKSHLTAAEILKRLTAGALTPSP